MLGLWWYLHVSQCSDTRLVQVVVTGHSLGAAVSSLNAFAAAITWPTADIHNTNIGSPLVGNQGWVNVSLHIECLENFPVILGLCSDSTHKAHSKMVTLP